MLLAQWALTNFSAVTFNRENPTPCIGGGVLHLKGNKMPRMSKPAPPKLSDTIKSQRILVLNQEELKEIIAENSHNIAVEQRIRSKIADSIAVLIGRQRCAQCSIPDYKDSGISYSQCVCQNAAMQIDKKRVETLYEAYRLARTAK